MDSVAVTVPLRPPMKKMKKRKELDALAPPRAILRRGSGKRSSQELLTDSSDDRSEYWNISTRGIRKCKDRRSRACPGLLRACSAFLACASVLATASLIWLFIDVRQQLTALRTELDQVIAGNEGVPDALQKCHSLSRDLQNNQTIIFTNLSDLKLQINNFTVQLVGIQHNLQQVQDWFQAAPQLANVPENLKAISTSVATFGSQIRDLDIRSETLKQNNAKVQAIQEAMQKNLTALEKTVQDLANIAQKPQLYNANETKIKTDELKEAIFNLTHNVTHINKTLSSLIQFNANDRSEDHKTLVSLQDKTQQVSTEVLSLRKECAKVSDQASILTSIQSLTTQVNEINKADKKFTERLDKLEQSCNNLQNTSSSISPTMTEHQPIMRAKRTSNNNVLDEIAVPTTHDKRLDVENSPRRPRRDTN